MKMPPENEIEHLKIDLPDSCLTKKKLAVFDLDETLVHCELKNPSKAQTPINIKLPNGKTARVSDLYYINRLDLMLDLNMMLL